MTATYRVAADNPHGINGVPEPLRSYLDACRHCHDGAVYTPTLFDHRPDRTVCSYDCAHGHDWTRGYTNL